MAVELVMGEPNMPSMTNAEENGNEARLATQEGGELDFSTFLTGTANDLKGYVNAQKRYLQLSWSERLGVLLGRLVANLAVLAATGFAMLFLNIALALYLGELLKSLPLGFVLVAAGYLLLLGVFHLWWTSGARERFTLDRINDLIDNSDVQKP